MMRPSDRVPQACHAEPSSPAALMRQRIAPAEAPAPSVMTGYHTPLGPLARASRGSGTAAIREFLAFGKAVYDERCTLAFNVVGLAERAGMTADEIECIEEGGTEPAIAVRISAIPASSPDQLLELQQICRADGDTTTNGSSDHVRPPSRQARQLAGAIEALRPRRCPTHEDPARSAAPHTTSAPMAPPPGTGALHPSPPCAGTHAQDAEAPNRSY